MCWCCPLSPIFPTMSIWLIYVDWWCSLLITALFDSCGSVGGDIYAPQSCHVQRLRVMSSNHCLKLILPWATYMPESSWAIWIHEMLHNCVFLNASWSCGLAICQKLILPYITRMPESSSCHVESTKLYTIVSIPMLLWSCGVAISRKWFCPASLACQNHLHATWTHWTDAQFWLCQCFLVM